MDTGFTDMVWALRFPIARAALTWDGVASGCFPDEDAVGGLRTHPRAADLHSVPGVCHRRDRRRR